MIYISIGVSYIFMVTAAGEIHWPINPFENKQKHTPDGHSPLTFYIRGPWQQVKTGPTWTGHLWFTGEPSFLLCFVFSL